MWLLIFETEIGSAAAPPGKLTRCAAQAQPAPLRHSTGNLVGTWEMQPCSYIDATLLVSNHLSHWALGGVAGPCLCYTFTTTESDPHRSGISGISCFCCNRFGIDCLRSRCTATLATEAKRRRPLVDPRLFLPGAAPGLSLCETTKNSGPSPFPRRQARDGGRIGRDMSTPPSESFRIGQGRLGPHPTFDPPSGLPAACVTKHGLTRAARDTRSH
jgi:hypothetical protein